MCPTRIIYIRARGEKAVVRALRRRGCREARRGWRGTSGKSAVRPRVGDGERPHGREKAVVVAPRPRPKSVAGGIKGDTGNDGEVDGSIVRESFSLGLEDAEGSAAHALRPAIFAQLHALRPGDYGQQDTARHGGLVYHAANVGLVGKRREEEEGGGPLVKRVALQPAADGLQTIRPVPPGRIAVYLALFVFLALPFALTACFAFLAGALGKALPSSIILRAVITQRSSLLRKRVRASRPRISSMV